MDKEDSFVRLLIILFITSVAGICLYWLPDHIGGYNLKKVDFLSDIRIKPAPLSIDSLMKQLEEQDSTEYILTESDSIDMKTSMDSAVLALRDSLYQTVFASAEVDSSGRRIEDYSVGRIGLARFFSALNDRKKLNRPVRIAFLGDSFIEGDIIVADLRSALQKEFGGNGVGFVPISSITDQFRPTINQKAEGWQSHSMLKDTARKYILSGMYFEPEENATLKIKPSEKYPDLADVSSLKLYYTGEKANQVGYVAQNEDTIYYDLPAKHHPDLLKINKPIHDEITLTFSEEKGIQLLGTAMEEEEGVVIDNFSLRGNSGLLLSHLDIESCNDFARIRPYDLIVLQYGLNVISEEVLNYGWYRVRMVEVVNHIKKCFPDADILLMGVSDRAYQTDDAFETMPAVLALLHAQKQIANKTGITFWNTFGAMGGVNSMVRYVENNWASKDYTHLSFRGGKEIAKALFEALISEKEFYDEADKSIQ